MENGKTFYYGVKTDYGKQQKHGRNFEGAL